MGLFDTYSTVKRGNQKITPNFLKSMGFHKDYWGSPHEDWKKPCSVFWEKYLTVSGWDDEESLIVATIWYFPETFTGYVTPYNMQGIDPLCGLYCQSYRDDNDFEIRSYAHCKMDILYAIDLVSEKYKQYVNYSAAKDS